MRQFNNNEKEIISKIVIAKKLDDQYLPKLIHDYVNASVISWDDKFEYIEIYDVDSNSDMIMNKFSKLLEIVFLLDYLSHNMYIGIYRKSKPEEAIYSRSDFVFDKKNRIVSKKTSPPDTTCLNVDHVELHTTLCKKISEYANSYFHVSENLVELVRNNFIPEEQLRFETQMNDTQVKHSQAMITAKKTLKWTQAAFVIAFLATIFTVTIGVFDLLSPKDMTIRELNKTMIDKKLPDVISAELTNDTVKVIVINPRSKNKSSKSIKK